MVNGRLAIHITGPRLRLRGLEMGCVRKRPCVIGEMSEDGAMETAVGLFINRIKFGLKSLI